MNVVQRIARNAGMLLVSRIVSRVLAFFYIMYVARYLGAEGFGILSFALAFTGMFGIISDLGLSRLIVREVSRDRFLASKYLNNIIVMNCILAVTTFGLIALTINLLDYPAQTVNVVYLIALSVILNAFSRIFYSIFQAYEKMEYQAIGYVLGDFLKLPIALFAIKQGFGIEVFASIYLFVNAVVLAYSFTVLIWHFVKPKFAVDLAFWKPMLKEAIPFGLSGIFITVYYWIDSIMLSLMEGNEIVGWYNAAYRLIVVLLFIPVALNTTVFPAMSKFYVSSRHSLSLIFRKYFKFMLIISIPMGVGVTLLADRGILLIFGEGYTQSIIALKILIWAPVFIFINAAFVRLFESINRQMIVTKITGVCMIENVVLNLLIIPRFSYIGASITTVITELTIVVLLVIFAYRVGYGFKRGEFLAAVSRVAVSSLIMGVFIWKLRDLNLLILVLISSLLYTSILFIVGGIDKDDIKIFKKVTGKTCE
ncbi:MAG: flippase [Candidatus Krumholzibacteriota bacterium]|nr:flippase [Candidatus Krumholzibacteriota bacterium]